jgi:hypothetical protein
MATELSRDKAIAILSELGVTTNNYKKKATFISQEKVVISCTQAELSKGDFFCQVFSMSKPAKEDNTIECIPYNEDFASMYYNEERASLDGNGTYTTYHVPIESLMVVWEDKPFKELEDANMNTMTLRDRVCIEHLYPGTNRTWLNKLIMEIVKSKKHEV